MKEKKLSIQSSVMWNSVGSIFYLGCQWILTVLVVRISGVETSGIFSLAMSVCNIWYCFSVYGMRNFQVSDTNEKYQNGTYIFSRGITIVASLMGCIIYCFVIPYSIEQKSCIILYFLFKISEAIFDVYAGIFQKNWRLDYVGKSLIIRGWLAIIVFLVTLVLFDNLVLTIACMMVSCNLSIFIYDIPHAKKIDTIMVNYNFRQVRELLIECFPLVVYTFLSSAIATIPRLFMERIMGNYELGIYGAVATPTLIIQMVATYVFNPFVTLFAEKYNHREKKGFTKTFINCSLVVLFVSIIGIVGGKIFGKWGLELIYGEEVAAYVELLIPLILCTVLTAFAWLLCGILTAIRQFRGLVLGNFVAVLVVTLISVPLEKQFGMQGASIALAIAVVSEILVLVYYLFHDMKKQFT